MAAFLIEEFLKETPLKEHCYRQQKELVAQLFEFLCNSTTHYFVVKGYAGTGKTWIVTRVLAFYNKHYPKEKICFTAPTNKATFVLDDMLYAEGLLEQVQRSEQSSGATLSVEREAAKEDSAISTATLYKFIGLMLDVDENGRQVLDLSTKSKVMETKILVIDESSMVNRTIFEIIRLLYSIPSPPNLDSLLKGKKVTKAYSDFVRRYYGVTAPMEIEQDFGMDNQDDELSVGKLKKLQERFACIIGKNKVIVLGDSKQLPPVKEPVSLFMAYHANYELNITVRQRNEELAAYVTETRNIENLRSFIWYKSGNFESIRSYSSTEEMVDEFMKNMDGVILCWRNDRVSKYNDMIRIKKYGEKAAKENKFFKGESLMFKKNYTCVCTHCGNTNYMPSCTSIEVKDIRPMSKKYNRVDGGKININHFLIDTFISCEDCLQDLSIFVIQDQDVGLFKDYLRDYRRHIQSLPHHNDTEREDVKDQWRRYYRYMGYIDPLIYAYSLTVHKAQGSTYKRCFVDLADIDGCWGPEKLSLYYTACSRAGEELHQLRCCYVDLVRKIFEITLSSLKTPDEHKKSPDAVRMPQDGDVHGYSENRKLGFTVGATKLIDRPDIINVDLTPLEKLNDKDKKRGTIRLVYNALKDNGIEKRFDNIDDTEKYLKKMFI